jgi:sporulation protein YlmC with PRC-barrel domain
MLHDLKALIGSSVIASNGEIGTVRNFLFDDISWTIHYLVVDVGAWFKRRDVVLAISAVEQPDREKRTINVRLTREQVRDSPDVDTEKPVSRQQAIAMEEYWGKMAYWVSTHMEGGALIPTGRKYPVHTIEDPHLRSAWDLLDYEVWATDGEIGRLEGLIMDEASWHLGYLDVKAGDWILNRSVLIPTLWVKSVSWADCRINLHHSRDVI